MANLTPEEMNRLSNEVLSALEIREARLLNWGFINGSQTLDDLDAQLPELLRPLSANSPELAVLWEQARANGVSAGDILTNLLERKLLFQIRNRYRSRFAETVRTLFLLRQRFSNDDWRTGDRLVSDLRILPQRRRYPRRDVSSQELLTQLDALHVPAEYCNAVRHLLEEPNGDQLTLSRFQAQAVYRIARNLAGTDDTALVIGAGTGAGKTKAFYIPALAHLVAAPANVPGVQVLALYPRKELLKDQLRETYAEARKLDDLLRRLNRPLIRVGAYYGDVPTDADDLLRGRRESWHRTRDRTGWICPYVNCPRCGHQSMIWLDEDVRREADENQRGNFGRHARLRCQDCNEQVSSEHVSLTRRQMLALPPDILFTTTEMLNRRLSNAPELPLFGIGAAFPPRLVLMDEIHLNEGIHGAQVGYLLRRWRNARGYHPDHSLCIVGLSATLTQAETFFSRLTGIPPQRVTYVTPADQDLVKEGIEYNVVLKGDPLSGTTLLSTSVRAAMLLCRILDPLGDDKSAGAYGQRAFAFSDKLDVINRWYHIEKEVENPVEPYSRFLFVPRGTRDERERYEQGQNWWFIPHIHDDQTVLVSGLRLDITSSQYAGVDELANLVIASSTLEVGYNDPTVGAVLQHKAPHSRAAFVQRKGRAGRPRNMRPWMVLVTSAYGRDRWAFQHAESLFDPILPPLDLPLENYYVRKIQAAFALLDWLAFTLKGAGYVEDVWQALCSHESARDPRLNPVRRRILDLLGRLLLDPAAHAAFRRHLQEALDIPTDRGYAVDTLLWGEPRPLLLEVVPTLMRQLETQWQRLSRVHGEEWRVEPWADAVANRPLPEFVPAALFSDLRSPELLVRIPESRTQLGKEPVIRAEETLTIALALSEYVPGKVNKRFARKDKIRESHWLEIPDVEAETTPTIDLEKLAVEYEPVSNMIDVEGGPYQVLCPREFTLNCVPNHVRPTSSARFSWQSHFKVRSRPANQSDGGSGVPLRLREGSPWQPFITGITAYTQSNGSWVEVTRLATRVQVSTRYDQGYERRATYGFRASGVPAAMGFAVDADALCVTFAPLDASALRQSATWPEMYRRFGSRYLLHLLLHDPRSEELQLDELQVEWLWQIAVTMIVQAAVASGCSLSAAAERVSVDYSSHARRVIEVIFRDRPLDFDGQGADEEDEPSATSSTGRVPPVGELDTEEVQDAGFLAAKLLNLIGDPQVEAMLTEHIPALWNDNLPGLDSWLVETYGFSLANTIFTALLEITPEVQPEDLHVDVSENSIWITEAAAGGVGLVAKLADTIAQRPRRLDLQLLRVARSCQRERLAAQLEGVARLVRSGDADLTRDFAAVRIATDLPRIEDTRLALTATLDRHSISTTRQLSVALNTKFLRPNSGPDTDALIASLVSFWNTEQDRLGCEIDLSVIAVAAAENPEVQMQVRQVLNRIGEGHQIGNANLVYNLLQSLLWMNCHDACPDCIERSARYQEGPRPSRALILALVRSEGSVVHFGENGWVEEVRKRLGQTFQATLMFDNSDLEVCQAELVRLFAEPIESGFQVLYPAAEFVERRGRTWEISLVLPELAGG